MAGKKTPTANPSDLAERSSEMWARLNSMAQATPSRTSLRQVLAFITLGREITQGRDVTIADLANINGAGDDGKPIFDASIGRSYGLFLDRPTKDYPEPLGWITLEEDPADRRRKLVRLTKKGLMEFREFTS